MYIQREQQPVYVPEPLESYALRLESYSVRLYAVREISLFEYLLNELSKEVLSEFSKALIHAAFAPAPRMVRRRQPAKNRRLSRRVRL